MSVLHKLSYTNIGLVVSTVIKQKWSKIIIKGVTENIVNLFVFYTTMSKCPSCGRIFQPGPSHSSALSRHYAICQSQKKNPPHDVSAIMHPGPLQSVNQSLSNTNYNSSHVCNNNGLLELPQNSISISPEQKELMDQDNSFKVKLGETASVWTTTELANLELLVILQKHNCHNSAHKDILGWFNHYQSLIDEKDLLCSNTTNYERKSSINSIASRFDMKGLQPITKMVEIDTETIIEVATFDFKQQILSLLRDNDIMNPSNLIMEDPSIAPKFDSDYISDVNDGEWYKSAYEYYNQQHGEDPNRLICGIILTIDKTHTDVKGKLCLEPVQFTLAILDKEIRKTNSRAWRCLGYVNDMETFEMKQACVDTTHDNKRNKSSNTENTKRKENIPKKHTIYHKMLSAILESYRDAQDIGLVWEIPFQTGARVVKLVFPLCLCVVDMKGAKQLCAMKDSAKRPCVSCNIHDLLDSTCMPVLAEDMKKLFENSVDESDTSKLDNVSQYKIEKNAFSDINVGGWKYGIWGLCPSEVLHQFYEGILLYCLEDFMYTLSGQSKLQFTEGVQKVIGASKSLGCKDLYPSGVFSMGTRHNAKMKGIEKFGCLFFYTLYLYTEDSKTLYFSHSNPKESSIKMNKWRNLFEKCLYYHDWMLQTSFKRSALHLKRHTIKALHSLIIEVSKRKDNKGYEKVPKLHEFFHVIRNIQWHGPGIGYDTRPAESNLKIHKDLSQHTQKHSISFCNQTANRLFEYTVVSQVFSRIKKFARNLYIKSLPSPDSTNDHCNTTPRSTKRNLIYLKFDRHADHKVTFYREKKGKVLDHGINVKYDTSLKSFLATEIMKIIPENHQHHLIKCYTTVIREGISFRGITLNDQAGSLPGWAMFQWNYGTSVGNTILCPAKMFLFMDLHDLPRTKQSSNEYKTCGLHAVVQSLQDTPVVTFPIGRGYPSLCDKGEFEKGMQFRIISESCIYDSCFVIPNLGCRRGESVLYVHPRHYNTTKEPSSGRSLTNLNSWASRF